MATTPGGLVYPVATDAFDPSGDIAALAAAADAGRIITVPNRAAATTLASALTTRPLYVHRQDAPAGSRLEVTEDGTTWHAISAGAPALTSVQFSSGWAAPSGSALPRYGVRDGMACLIGGPVQRTGGAFSITAGTTYAITSAGAIPSGLAPALNEHRPAMGTGTTGAAEVIIGPTGTISLRFTTAFTFATSTLAVLPDASWPIPA